MNSVPRPRLPSPPALLLSRKQTAELLGGISIATVIRYEQEGRLKPIRLTRNGQVFHRRSDIEQLVEQAAELATAAE